MKSITKVVAVVGTCLCMALSVSAADDRDPREGERYSSGETVFEAFGTASYGQTSIDNITATRVRHDARVGAGVGLSYYVTKCLGFGGDLYTENTGRSFIDSTSGNIIGRFPLGQSGVAPYVFGGMGYEFDLNDTWFGQVGGGIEYRFTHQAGVFVDGRYVLANDASNYGVIRAGFRFAF